MATQTEQLAIDAHSKIDVLRAEFNLVQDQFQKLSLGDLRERLAVIENRLAELDKAVEKLKPTKAESEEMGAIKNRLTQLEEQKKLADTRLFQFYMLFAGGIMTLAVQVAILFLKK